jgi:uncharacterized phage-associated protein
MARTARKPGFLVKRENSFSQRTRLRYVGDAMARRPTCFRERNMPKKPIKFVFKEKKAVQTAAWLIAKSGGEINYLALMKLLYLIDREALLRFGQPITGDNVVAMKHGPVLSRIYDRVSHKKQSLPESYWHKFIPRPGPYRYTVKFSAAPATSALSEGELALIAKVFAKHSGKDEWELVEFTHNLPEWEDPKDTSLPIAFEDILKAGGASKETIAAIANEAEEDLLLSNLIARARSATAPRKVASTQAKALA